MRARHLGILLLAGALAWTLFSLQRAGADLDEVCGYVATAAPDRWAALAPGDRQAVLQDLEFAERELARNGITVDLRGAQAARAREICQSR